MPAAVPFMPAIWDATGLVRQYVHKYDLGLHKLSLSENLGLNNLQWGKLDNGNPSAPTGFDGTGIRVNANYSSTEQPAQFIYGTLRVGGMDTIPGFTSGASGVDLHRVITLGVGRIDDVRDQYINNEYIPNSAFTATTNSGFKTVYSLGSYGGMSSTALTKYKGYLEVSKALGTSSHAADYNLASILGSSYPNFRGNNLAWIGLKYTLNGAHDNYDALPEHSFVVRGICCYDPRKDSTVSGGSGSHRFSDPTTWEHTECPPLCIAHYLTHQLAGGFDYDEISWQTVMTAADVCDTLVYIPTGTQKRFTCNGMLFAPLSPQEFIDGVNALTASCLGRTIYTNGVWEIYAGSWTTPAATIDRKDWVSKPKIRLEGGDHRRFNSVVGWYYSNSRNYERTSTIRSNSAYQAADGGVVRQSVDLPFCTSDFEAQRRCEIILRQTRNQIEISGELPHRFSDLAMLQPVTLVDTSLGWTSKTARMIGNVIDPEGSYASIFREEQSTDWTDLTTADYASNFSSYQLPSVNDLSVIRQQGVFISRLAPDPNFSASTANGSYWISPYFSSVFSLQQNAGPGGGLLSIAVTSRSADASQRAIYSLPVNSVKWAPGMQIGVSALVRVTSTMSWDTSVASVYTLQLFPVAWTGVGSPNLQELGGGGNCRIFSNSHWLMDITGVASQALNEWRRYDDVLVLDVSSISNPSYYAQQNSYPYLVMAASIPQIPNGRTGVIEIGYISTY